MYKGTTGDDQGDLGQTMRGVVGGSQLFGRFTLQKVLGRGGMGIVWLARDDRLDRLVALKLVPETICFDASAQEDLKRETRKSLLLTHPNIVRIFDFIEDERTAAISMEYVDGATLSYQRVQQPSKCFEVADLIPWVTSLCDALAYAHETVRLIHRDLKPANLMVNSRSELKITDFGIACSLRESMSCVSVRTSSGTLNYMSPQQMLGEDPSPSDDIYSMGALLFEMVTSKPPFHGGNVPLQVREVTAPTMTQRRAKFKIEGDPIPKYWEETIAACLAKEPEQRPKTPADVARRLRLGGPIRLSEKEKRPAIRLPKIPKINSHVVAFGGGIIAILLVIFTIQHLHRRPKAALVRDANLLAPAIGYATEVPPKRTAATPVPAQKIGAPPRSLAPPKDSEASKPVADSPSGAMPNGTLQLSTTPAGATFAIYAGVIAGRAAPATEPLRSGTAPESISDMPPGHYTIFLHHDGWPDDRAEVSLEPGESLPVNCTFPHATATITSAPDGAEIFLGGHSLGHTPLTIDLPPGRQQLTGRHPDFPDRTQTVLIENDKSAHIAFQFHARSRSSSKAKPKPTPTALDKIGNTLKKVFGAKPSPSPTKSRKKH
jgi:serine/threonine protein kinase